MACHRTMDASVLGSSWTTLDSGIVSVVPEQRFDASGVPRAMRVTQDLTSPWQSLGLLRTADAEFSAVINAGRPEG